MSSRDADQSTEAASWLNVVRVSGLFGEDRPHVAYSRATRPLLYEADRLETICHDGQIGFVVIDSVVPASSGSANDAEAAAGVYGVLRRLGVGSLVVSHVTKASQGKEVKPEDATPYGSAFWWNLARSAWHLRRATDDADGSRQTLGLFNSKNNYGKFAAIGLEIEFRNSRIVISNVDAATVPEFAGALSVSHRLRNALKRGPRSIDQRVGDDLVALADSRNIEEKR